MLVRACLPLMIPIAVVCCVLASGTFASAKIWSTLSDEQLLDQADVVVRARPVDTGDFIVEEVLRGPAYLETERIRVDTRDYEFVSETGEEVAVRDVVLFLRPAAHGDFDYEPIYSGVRYLLTEEGLVLIPAAYGFFGWGFRTDDGFDWECLLANLRGLVTGKKAIHDAFRAPDPDLRWVEMRPDHQDGLLTLRPELLE